jgi:hypothetical protein
LSEEVTMTGPRALLLLASLGVSLSACSGKNLDLGGPEPSSPNDVRGIVQSPDGVPLTVNVMSGDARTTTDAQGRFVLRNLPPRYDVSLAAPPQADAGPYPVGPFAIVYLGLTTRTPILTVPRPAVTSGLPQAPTSLNVTFPKPTSVDTRYLVFDSVPPYGTMNPSPTPTTFQVPGPYGIMLPPGASSIDALVASLTFAGPTATPPSNFLGYATAYLHFEANRATQWSPTFAPVDSMTVLASPTLEDPAQTLYEGYLAMRMSDMGVWAPIADPPVSSPPWSYVVPKAPGVTWAILFNAQKPAPTYGGGAKSWAWARVGSDGTVEPVRIPAAPHAVSPPDATTGFGFGSVLTWTGAGVCTVDVQKDGNYPNPSAEFFIVSDQQTATIPDTTSLGVTFPRNTTYRWMLECAQSSEPPIGGDPVLLPNDPLASGGWNVDDNPPTVVTR